MISFRQAIEYAKKCAANENRSYTVWGEAVEGSYLFMPEDESPDLSQVVCPVRLVATYDPDGTEHY